MDDVNGPGGKGRETLPATEPNLPDAPPRSRRHNADGRKARGSSNGNQRGGSEQRRARRAWLLEAYAADEQLVKVTYLPIEQGAVDYMPVHIAGAIGLIAVQDGLPIFPPDVVMVELVPTARCYRCGILLHDGTITVDRIIPGAHGGTYRRNNIRPACAKDNSSTGAPIRRKR